MPALSCPAMLQGVEPQRGQARGLGMPEDSKNAALVFEFIHRRVARLCCPAGPQSPWLPSSLRYAGPDARSAPFALRLHQADSVSHRHTFRRLARHSTPPGPAKYRPSADDHSCSSFGQRCVDRVWPSTPILIRDPPVVPMTAPEPRPARRALERLALAGRHRNDHAAAGFAEEQPQARPPVAPGHRTAGRSTVRPIPPLSKAHSASVTGTPPSAQSCADSISRRAAASTSTSISARSRPRSTRGRSRPRGHERSSDTRCRRVAVGLAEQDDLPALLRNTRPSVQDASSMTPTTPMMGVG